MQETAVEVVRYTPHVLHDLRKAHRRGKLKKKKNGHRSQTQNFQCAYLFGVKYIIGTARSVGHYINCYTVTGIEK